MLEGSYLKKGNFCNFFYLNSTTDVGVIEINDDIIRYDRRNAKRIGGEIKSFIRENPAREYFIDLMNTQFMDSHALTGLGCIVEDAEYSGKKVNLTAVSRELHELMNRCDNGDVTYRDTFRESNIPEDVRAEVNRLRVA